MERSLTYSYMGMYCIPHGTCRLGKSSRVWAFPSLPSQNISECCETLVWLTYVVTASTSSIEPMRRQSGRCTSGRAPSNAIGGVS